MEVTPEDLKFPKAVISRIIKDALPEGANISNEAKTAIARSAAIFILHATSLANENAQAKKRKNVLADDILYAVRQLECEELEKPILEGLQMFKQKKSEKYQIRKIRRDQKATESQTNSADLPVGDEEEVVEETDEEHQDAGGQGSDEEDIVELDEE